MNRRTFVQSLMAALSLPAGPAMSLQAISTGAPAAAAVPAHARSWAVYLSALHGECTPRHLQSLLNIDEADARRYVSQLITDGVLKPNPLLQQSVRNLVRSVDRDPLDVIEKHLDENARAHELELERSEEVDGTTSESFEADALESGDEQPGNTSDEPDAAAGQAEHTVETESRI